MKLYYYLLLLTSAAYAQAVSASLFHGTSVVIRPNSEAPSPANSTILAANFFCYMSNEGYFSFGWWVPASLDGDTTHCAPDSQEYHWYESAEKIYCDENAGTCQYRTQNFLVRPPGGHTEHPFPVRPLRYFIRLLDLGNGEQGRIAQSYIDDGEVQVYAVGTRQTLSSGYHNSDCLKALQTLRKTQELYKPRLNFSIRDICGETEDSHKMTMQHMIA
ncbi:hypothetical protein F5Y11DRAFT_194135 [Daldinia sp. FL1419]|nr:hypothetical protein F5Y11DRAFT_194135 [Daldinia sp. FL1419]